MIIRRHWQVIAALGWVAACHANTPESDHMPDKASPSRSPGDALASPSEIPTYLQRDPDLQIRDKDRIVRAPAADQAVAKTYATSHTRGPLADGARITILTARLTIAVGEEVRVIHVYEVPGPGETVYVMGPKEVYGELVDGVDARPDPKKPQGYDGATVESPWADFNYDITTYTFRQAGRHTIEWHKGHLRSNVLELDVQ